MVSSINEYAHEYQIPTVLSEAETIIVNLLKELEFNQYHVQCDRDQAFELAFEILAFAENFDNNEILSTAIARIARVPESYFKKHSTYKCLSPDNKIMLLEGRLALYASNIFFQ